MNSIISEKNILLNILNEIIWHKIPSFSCEISIVKSVLPNSFVIP